MTNDSLSELQTHSLVFPPMGESLFFVQIHHLSYFGGDDMIFGVFFLNLSDRFQGLVPWMLGELELTIVPRKIGFSP